MAKKKLQPAPQLLAADRARIGEIMTRGAVTVRADNSLEQLVALFLEQGISRVPVVDDDGRAIGIASKTDLVIDQYERAIPRSARLVQAGAAATCTRSRASCETS